MDIIIKQLTKDHNIEKFIDSFNKNKKNNLDTFTFDLIKLIELDFFNSSIYKEAIIKLILNKDKINSFYSRSIDSFKNEKNELLKKSSLMPISTQLFTTEYYNHFSSLAIGHLLETKLNDVQFEECKNIIFKSHLDITLKLISFDFIPYYNEDSFSNTFNCSLYHHLKNLINCYFGKEMLDILVSYINSDLSNRKFIYKNEIHHFSELKVDYSNCFKILINIQNSFVNINKVKWIK